MLPDIRPLLLEIISLSQAVDRSPLWYSVKNSVSKACMSAWPRQPTAAVHVVCVQAGCRANEPEVERPPLLLPLLHHLAPLGIALQCLREEG